MKNLQPLGRYAHLALLFLFFNFCSSPGQNVENGRYDYLMQVGEGLIRDQRYAEAYPVFQQAHDIRPNSFQAASKAAYSLIQMQELRMAKERLEELCSQHNSEASCPLLLALTQVHLGELQQSRHSLNQAQSLGVFQQSSQYAHVSGLILLAEGRSVEAKRVFESAISRYPESCELFLGYLNVLSADQAFEDALLAIPERLENCASVAELHLWEAYFYSRSRQRELARIKLEKIAQAFRGQRAESQAREALRNLAQGVPLAPPSDIRKRD